MAVFPEKVSYNYVAPRLGLGYFVAKNKIAQQSCLSTLVCSAIVGGVATSKRYKSGKVMNYAFKVPFIGESTGDGRLIEGAQPRWNIWSNNSPGEWTLPIIESGDPAIKVLDFRLKRDSSNQVRFNEADFSGYDPDAVSPTVPELVMSGIPNSQYNPLVKTKLGSYDWKKVSPALQYVKLMKINSRGLAENLSDPVALSSAISTGLNIPIKVSIPAAGSTSEEMYLALCNQFGDEQAYLPNPGNLTLVAVDYTFVIINVVISIDGYVARGRSKPSEILSGYTTWGSTLTNTTMLRNAPLGQLVRVEYNSTNADGETIQKIRTSIDFSRDSPLYTTDFKEIGVGTEIGVSVRADSEMYAHAGAAGGNIVINMIYN